jgi:arylsulfatase A-like enzyme
MQNPNRLLAFALVMVTTLVAHRHCLAAQPKSWNIVFFLVDDLGWADVGCFGSSFHRTPSIDALCASGMKFNYGYAACPVCSPTRASILTGRHPVRVGITDWIPGARARRGSNPRFLHVDDRDNLALDEVTIAEALKEKQYQTFFAGKWHLGDRGHWPTDQGFDFNVGGNSKGSPPGGYYAPWKNPTLQAREENEYLTERLTQESISFLQQRDASKPFLLYLSYYNVHTPITAYKKRYTEYAERAKAMFSGETPKIAEHRGFSRGRQDNAQYASMVAAVDDSVGAVLDKVAELGLEKDTAVFFFSDNGGLCTKATPGPTCNLPLRSGKGWLYEGGVREPTIIRVPGVTKPGSISDDPIVSMDFFPTILHLAGIDQRPDLHCDGVDLMPVLKGGQFPLPRALYWHYPHYHGSTWTPGASIRDGQWKLIEFYEFDEVELYNLAEDPGEQKNLASEHAAKASELREKLRRWQTAMKASMPRPNPHYTTSSKPNASDRGSRR